jgi:hypothetical protein
LFWVLHPADSPLPPVSAGQFTVPVTVLQRAQITRIGAHHGRHRLTGGLRQIGGSGAALASVRNHTT